MFGRRRHGEKASNGKPVKKLIKTANEEIAVLGRGTQQSKASRTRCFFCVVFPIQGTRALLTLNSPFTVFEKRGFQNPSSGGFSEPQKKRQRGPHEILVLVGR